MAAAMTAQDEWTLRGARLARIVAGGEIGGDCPLVKGVRIPSAAFARMRGAVSAYLWNSLCWAYPDRSFGLGDDLVVAYATEILSLPNRTPNGVLLPRRETFASFNLVHQALGDAMEALDLVSCFSLLQIPCNVRIVGGPSNPSADERRYSSAKIHTDIWNGEPISSILFNIPVLGDPRAVDLIFYEAAEFNEVLRVPLNDYSLGNEIAARAKPYPLSFDMGQIYVSDALSLHRTVKRSPALRVSLDFRTIAKELLPGESAEHPDSRAVYVAPDVWRASGSTIILGSGEPIDAFQRRSRGETIRRDRLSIVGIDDEPVPPPRG